MLSIMFPFEAVHKKLVVEKKLKLRKEFFINSFSTNVPIEFHTSYIFLCTKSSKTHERERK